MEPTYRLVFNLAYRPFYLHPAMLVPALLLGIGILAVVKPNLMKRLLPGPPKNPTKRVFFWIYLTLGAVFTIVFLIINLGEAYRLSSALKRGATPRLEGCLQAFHPMSATRHDQERLTIGGRTFEYSDAILTHGFHHTEIFGGPVHADSAVRLSYVDGDIVRLEVADHACPKAPDTLGH